MRQLVISFATGLHSFPDKKNLGLQIRHVNGDTVVDLAQFGRFMSTQFVNTTEFSVTSVRPFPEEQVKQAVGDWAVRQFLALTGTQNF
jgi:hypothetical protein